MSIPLPRCDAANEFMDNDDDNHHHGLGSSLISSYRPLS